MDLVKILYDICEQDASVTVTARPSGPNLVMIDVSMEGADDVTRLGSFQVRKDMTEREVLSNIEMFLGLAHGYAGGGS